MENLFLLRANKQQTKSIMTKERTREEIMAMYNRHIETVYFSNIQKMRIHRGGKM